jgi:hypothetical protein
MAVPCESKFQFGNGTWTLRLSEIGGKYKEKIGPIPHDQPVGLA